MLTPYTKNHPRNWEERRKRREGAALKAGQAALLKRARPSARDRHHEHRADRRATRQGLVIRRRFVVLNHIQHGSTAA